MCSTRAALGTVRRLSKFATHRRAIPSRAPRTSSWGIVRILVVISTARTRLRYWYAPFLDSSNTGRVPTGPEARPTTARTASRSPPPGPTERLESSAHSAGLKTARRRGPSHTPRGCGARRAPAALGDRLPYELRPPAASPGRDLLELLRRAIVELHEDLLHIVDHIISAVIGTSRDAVMPRRQVPSCR